MEIDDLGLERFYLEEGLGRMWWGLRFLKDGRRRDDVIWMNCNFIEKQASLSGKRRKVVESDEEYDVKEEMGNQDDLDFIDDKELEDLVKDEEEDDPYLNYKSTIKTPAQNRTKEFPTFRTKQTTEWDASKRLDMFGFNKSNEKSVVKSTKTSAFKPRKTNVSTKLPSFTENKEKVNEMEQMSEDQIADGLPEFLHNDKKKDEKGRLMSDPDYDPTTLYIPPAYFNQQTAAMKQFWTIKSK